MFKFPYTNFSVVNLDWVLNNIKEVENSITALESKDTISGWIYAGKYILNSNTPALGYTVEKSKVTHEILITLQSNIDTTVPANNIIIPASMLYSTSNTTYNAGGNYGDRENNLVYNFKYANTTITITICTVTNGGNIGCLVWGAISPIPESGDVEIAVFYR